MDQLLSRLISEGRLAVLSWEKIIDAIMAVDGTAGEELFRFYEKYLTFAPLQENIVASIKR